MSRLLLVVMMVPLSALAQVNECAEAAAECREDCSIEHSSLRPDAPKKLNKCLKKCQKKLITCEERELETRTNSLEAGSLDKSPVSGDVDENNMPTRTAVKKAKSTDEEEKRAPLSEDLRDDRPTPAEPVKTAKKPKSDDAEARPPPREELREAEVPKSSRAALKVDEKEAPKAAPPPAKSSDPEPVVMTPKAETRKEEDLRDDRPKAEPAPVKKGDKPKKDDLPAPPPKPKEEDHDDLRNY
ncbi:MAG: hypothetical protein IAE78_21165 [Myxococcus sp.]|nr:hypothetical protein [Myxococcus sp.]